MNFQILNLLADTSKTIPPTIKIEAKISVPLVDSIISSSILNLSKSISNSSIGITRILEDRRSVQN